MRGESATNERTYVGRLDGGSGRIAWHVDALTRETDNVDIDGFATAAALPRPSAERKGQLSNSYSDSDSYAGGLSWVAEKGYLGASFIRNEQAYGLPGPEAEEATTEAAIFEGPLLDMNQTRIDVRSEYWFDRSVFRSVKFDFGTNDYEHKEIEPSGELATRFDNDAWQARVQLALMPWAAWDGVVGMQLDDRNFSAVGKEAFVSPTATESTGVFVTENGEFAWGQLFFGARFEATEHDNSSGNKYDASGLSVGLGATFNLPHALELTMNVARTERHPNAEELFSNGTHIATRQYEIGLVAEGGGSADTEHSLNVDIGLSRQVGDVRFDANLFFYDIGDYVHQDIADAKRGAFPIAQYTQGDAEFYGFEIAVVFPLVKPQILKTDLRVFADYVSASLDNSDDLPRIPPWRTGANLKLEWKNWHAGADLRYHSNITDISSFNTSAYTMLDLNALYKIDGHHFNWEIFARATNLLDENARKSTSVLAAFAPLAGRSLLLGVRLKF